MNRSLGNLLQCLVGDHPKSWDAILPLAEFAYNSSLNKTINTSPFEMVYGLRPSSVVDLALLPISSHAKLKPKIEKFNAKYKAAVDVRKWRLLFKEGDLVWVIFSKGRQPHGHYMKLNDWKVGP